MSGVKREPEESGSSASRHSQQQHYYQQPPSSSPYTSSSSSSAASHHPSHQHSMPAPASDPNAMDSDQPPHSSAPSGPTYTLPPLPELEEYLAHVHPQHFRTFLPQVDLYDFKASKLPLARIKKIMKSDEDVRMISAEAPVLFAKACELFIMDLTLRAWSRVDHCKRHTIQKNDVAAVIQSAELFDFLHQIVPIGALDPDEEGSPAHHPISSLDEENARFRSNVPDVLLERPLHDPYDDSLPPMHTQTTVLRQQMSREHASGSYRSTGSAPPMDDDAREVLLSPITPGPPLLPRVGLMHQQVIMQQQQQQQNNSAASLPTPNEYGMTSMSRGISTEGTVGGGSMSTPNFNADISGSSSDLENTPQSHAANTFNNPNLPSVLTPLTPMLSNMPPQTPNPNYYPPQQMHHQQRQQLQQQQLQPQPSPNLIPQTPLTSFATPGGVGTSSFDMPPSPGLVGANSVPVGGAPPGVVPSTPSSLSLNTPNFQAGYQPDGSTEEEMEAQEE